MCIVPAKQEQIKCTPPPPPHTRTQLFSTGKEKEHQYEQDHFLNIADVSDQQQLLPSSLTHTHSPSLPPSPQGFILVYEIPSKASYDLVISLRQKIVLKNKDVRLNLLSIR